ncbi:MAG: FAD-dependent monooxygenase [Rubrivivax sp.]|nr:FAD-dependent monooxygenase [Rubrivivax sp.]
MVDVDVLVRGGGVVGLSAALALARQGLSVAVLEQPVQSRDGGRVGVGVSSGDSDSNSNSNSNSNSDARAFALNAASVQLLTTLKVWAAMPPDARTAVYEMHVEGDTAGTVLDFSAWSQSLPELAWIVDAGELESALRAAARFAPRLEFVSQACPAALQVLAEGRDSATRQQLGVAMPRHAYGQRAVAARLVSGQPHAGIARQWFRSPDVLALLPLSRPQPERSYGLVWSVPDSQADLLMAMDDAAFAAAVTDATQGAAGALTLAGRRAQWPLALARADAVHGPGWVLVGDSAHVVHPLAGQGLNLGLADVAVLAQEIAGRESWRALGDVRLGARYARRRRGPTWAMAQVTDGLLQLFAHPAPLARELRNRGLTLVNRLPPLKRLLTGMALGG